MPLFSVRPELLPMKAHFLLFNAGTSPIVPFLPVYAKQLGFSSLLVGSMYTVLPMMGMVVKPLTGAIADKFHCHKTLFISFLIVTIVSFFSMLFIPAIGNSEIHVEINCEYDSFLKLCSSTDIKTKCMDEKTISSINKTINCQLDCIGDKAFIEEVCTSWNIPHYCASVSTEPNHFGLAVAKHFDQAAGKTANIKPTTAKRLIAKAPQTLNFEAQLNPYNTELEKNCFFIRLTKIKDANSHDDWHVPYCKKFEKASCKAMCYESVLSEIYENENSDGSLFGYYQYWLFISLMIFSWIGMAVVVSIGDTICFGLLGDSPELYGYQRLWGSVGWGSLSIIAGLLIDEFSDGQTKKNYTPVIYLMAVLLLLNVMVAMKLKDTQRIKSHTIFSDISKLLMNARIIVFMVWCIVVGMCTAVVWNFLFWHLEDLAKCEGQNWIKTLEGLIMCIQCFGGELPFFFISGWLLKKIGHINAMSLVLFGFGVRFLLYSVLIDPWWCLPIELLNGLTFGMFYATMASYATIVAPPGTEATIQGLTGAIFEGIGVSSGSFIAGLLFYYMDGATVFRLYGLIVLVICALHVTVQFYLSRSIIPDISNKGLNSARYASPNDAISMLADQCELTNS